MKPKHQAVTFLGCFFFIILLDSTRSLFRERDLPSVVLAMAAAYSITRAMYCFAESMGRKIQRHYFFLIFLTWPIAIPLCLVHLKRSKAILPIFMFVILYLILSLAPFMVMEMAPSLRSLVPGKVPPS